MVCGEDTPDLIELGQGQPVLQRSPQILHLSLFQCRNRFSMLFSIHGPRLEALLVKSGILLSEGQRLLGDVNHLGRTIQLPENLVDFDSDPLVDPCQVLLRLQLPGFPLADFSLAFPPVENVPGKLNPDNADIVFEKGRSVLIAMFGKERDIGDVFVFCRLDRVT
jgi:hypothetical protein